jgi:MoaA/NifB/PqqE/SkfB family radical SAM enzyme
VAGQLVTIETGLACNNCCSYCPQPFVRGTGPAGSEPSTEELVRKLESARREGITEAAFSGGEPTIRKDLQSLIAHARSIGFGRVSITTNGRMLSYPGYARKLLDAGLTGVSVSLHGPNAAVHDALTGVPGSFRQTVSGLDNMRLAAGDTLERFEIQTVTIIVPENVAFLRDTLVLAGSLGAGLHIVQPFIVSRENLHLADRFLMTHDELAAAIRTLMTLPLPHGGRIKPYNLAPCLFQELSARLEMQDYRLKTIREFEDTGCLGKNHVSRQFFRIPSCKGCEWRCPGLRMEHLPQDDLARMILEDVSGRDGGLEGQDITISSTDLLGRSGLDLLLKGLRSSGVRRLRLLWGGFARATINDLMESCIAYGVDEVCLVAIPPAIRLPDRRVILPGNLDLLARQLPVFVDAGRGPSVSLFLVVNMLFDPCWKIDEGSFLGLLGSVFDAGGRSLFLSSPAKLGPDYPETDDDFLEQVKSALPSLVQRIRAAGINPVLLRCAKESAHPTDSRLEEWIATILPVVRWDEEFLQHRYASSDFGWLMWSYPIWVRDRP